MRKILIDGRLLSNKPTGISRYTEEVIHSLIEQYGREDIFVIVDTKYSNINNYNIIPTILKPYNPLHFLLFSFYIYKQKFSVYYSTFYSGIYFKTRKTKQILTVHDLMYLRIENYFSTSSIRNNLNKILLNFIVKSSLRSGNLIISVSKTTKSDLLEYFKKDSIVIGEGINYLNEKPSSTNIFDKLQIQKGKYFLYIGNFRRQKNIPFLIEAFNLSKTPYQLLLVGNGIFQKNKNENVIYAGMLEDHEIQNLYKNCLAFIMPSLYEGFGLPILEAYNAGARVLSSNQGALAEFQDLNINYFSPFKINELVSLLQNIDNLPKPTESEINLARIAYSWKNQNIKIIDSIESLINRQ